MSMSSLKPDKEDVRSQASPMPRLPPELWAMVLSQLADIGLSASMRSLCSLNRALANIDPSVVTEQLAERAAVDCLPHVINVLSRWDRRVNGKTEFAQPIFLSVRVLLAAVRYGSPEILDQLFCGSLANPPPWLEESRISPHPLANRNDVAAPSSILQLSPLIALFSEMFHTAANRSENFVLTTLLKFCEPVKVVYYSLVDIAPAALLRSCESGHVEVSKTILELCWPGNGIRGDHEGRLLHRESLLRCVLSRKVELVRMVVLWWDDRSKFVSEMQMEVEEDFENVGDPFDPTVPLVEDVGRFVCGVSREVWRRCVDVASRDGSLEILEILFTEQQKSSEDGLSLNSFMPPNALHMAVLNSHLEVARFLLARGCSVSRVAFATAISNNSTAILQELLSTGVPPPSGAVSFSIESRSFDCLILLLGSSSCSVSATDVLFAAKYSAAYETRNMDIYSATQPVANNMRSMPALLLVMNACPDEYISEALNMAVHEGNAAVVSLLLNSGAIATESSFTSAVFLNNREILMSLIVHKQLETKLAESGLSKSGESPKDPTHLFQAALTCTIDIENISLLSIILATTSAQPTTSDLFIAARKSNPTIARFLVRTYPGLAQAPLDLAVRQKNLRVLLTLIDACGCVPSVATVSAAIETHDVTVVAAVMRGLAAAPTPLSADDSDVVLGSAICCGNEIVVEAVLEAPGCVWSPGPVHVYLAAKRGMESTVKLLLRHARSPDSVSGMEMPRGSSPLDLAVREGNETAVTVLINAGVRVGAYAIAAAVENGRLDLLLELIRGGRNLRGPEVSQETNSIVPPVVVALALQSGSLLMLRTLLDGFDVHVTAVLLLMGVRTGSLEIVGVLLNHYNGPVGRDILEAAFAVNFDLAELLIDHVLNRNV
ncbi:hypothetical protein HDU82_000655 [Entophlyctis luteolus]|nr:hypothetical protein HDU82_000655 [Entophlyctis luteolus]